MSYLRSFIRASDGLILTVLENLYLNHVWKPFCLRVMDMNMDTFLTKNLGGSLVQSQQICKFDLHSCQEMFLQSGLVAEVQSVVLSVLHL